MNVPHRSVLQLQDMSHGIRLLVLFLLGLGTLPVGAQDAAMEHPIVKPVEGSRLLAKESSREDFGSLRVAYEGEAGAQKDAEGVFWKLVYQIDDMGRDEIKANFIAAAKGIGGEKYGLNRATRANFRIPASNGGISWLYLVLRSGGTYELNIIDEAPLDVAVAFDAEGFSKELREEGRVSVYGILFATDSDRILPGSGAALDVISQVLLDQTDLNVEIQGHTDSTGSAARNQALSVSRASSVQSVLELFGIPAARTRAKGYGASMPVADNATEDGRQLNRRVDFVLLEDSAPD